MIILLELGVYFGHEFGADADGGLDLGRIRGGFVVGLAAIGEVYQEAIIIAYGDGSNGKSTFWNTIAGAMGNYAGMISADALTVGCRRNVKPELAEVKGKRILIAAELEEGMRLSTSIVKQLSSTDEIEGEKKYKDPFKFRPTHTLVLYTNHLPKVGAMDTGIWRRLIVIPFDAKITGKSDIKNYSKYLLTNAGPYITKWIIEGAQKAITDNYKLKVPKCVKDAIERYKSDNDHCKCKVRKRSRNKPQNYKTNQSYY